MIVAPRDAQLTRGNADSVTDPTKVTHGESERGATDSGDLTRINSVGCICTRANFS